MHGPSFAGEVVTFLGRLLTMSRKRAGELVVQSGGHLEADLTPQTTIVVVGADTPGSPAAPGAVDLEVDRRLRRAQERAQEARARFSVWSEDAFCDHVGFIAPSTLRGQYYTHAAIQGMYPAVRDHLRYLEKWGVLRSVVRTPGETWFGFADLAVIKQANEDLARGVGLKTVLRTLAAAREGQLALNFQPRDASQRVVRLSPRPARPEVLPGPAGPSTAAEAAEELFAVASRLDSGDPASRPAVMAAYRRALLVAPQLAPALVNLGNLHYADDHLAEAQALYLQAALADPDCFEAHFNLGNLFHDLGRFVDAEASYREALRIHPGFADAHFYLAVTLEKQRRSPEARAHWRRYQELAPEGEWVQLAQEFTD
jgi:tetratricopeptide (TPR) repeat protein